MASLKKQILSFIERPGYDPLKPKALGKKLGVSKKTMESFLELLEQLVAEEKLKLSDSGRIQPIKPTHALIGILRRIKSGSGFVILHEPKPATLKDDVFIDARDMGDAQTGDEVAIVLTNARRRNGGRCGIITDVIERATNLFVGTYFVEDGQGYVQIDGTNFDDAIWVGDPGAKGARDDDKVVIEMVRFPTHHQLGEAVLTKVLGPRGEPGIDTQTVIYEYGLPNNFPEDVLQEARNVADQFDETDLEDRLDLTRDTIITIDPKDARDFDDAISLTRTDNGHWHLGVHIADVAHFVKTGSKLDDEAYKRGTSVYLPTQVIPMLPEVISNGLASLQEGKVRYVKSVFIEFSEDGIPVDTRFSRSAIKVTRRFAYEQVMTFLNNPEQQKNQLSDRVYELLLRIQELAKILRERRFKAGSLELSMPEIDLTFDKDGRVNGAVQAVHDESHQIIEEFMLAANIAIATELATREIPFLRRTHDEPRMEKMKLFGKFVESIGFSLPEERSKRDIQNLLDQVQGQPLQHAVNFAFLRSLKQAEYSPVEIGHYALSVSNYCHFTSPIRRYPDLTIHRIIDKLIDGGKYKGPNAEQLAKLGLHCSTTERRAEKAERELTKLKLLQYMGTRIGDEFEAIITGVERFGIFCECVEVPAEGMIHISSLAQNDRLDYDRDSWTLTGRRTGMQFRLGGRLKVKVAMVDLDRRSLDLSFVSMLQSRPNSKGKKTNQSRSTTKSKSRKSKSSKKTSQTSQSKKSRHRKKRR